MMVIFLACVWFAYLIVHSRRAVIRQPDQMILQTRFAILLWLGMVVLLGIILSALQDPYSFFPPPPIQE